MFVEEHARWVPKQAPFPLRLTRGFSLLALASPLISSPVGAETFVLVWEAVVSPAVVPVGFSNDQWVTGGHTGQGGGIAENKSR